MLMVGRAGGSQNRLEPHSAQKPRRAPASLFGLSIHRRPRCSVRVRSSRRAAVLAEKWPCQRRHSSQWQMSTSRRGPRTSYRTAPHRHPPVGISGDNSSMAYDEALAERIRELLATDHGVVEKKMFGGLAFLIGGNMSVSASGQGGLL